MQVGVLLHVLERIDKEFDGIIVRPAIVADGMQRLVNVPDEMHQVHQRFFFVLGRSFVVPECVLISLDFVDRAVAATAIQAVPHRFVFVGVKRDVDKVPIVGFGPFVADVVCPTGNRGERYVLPEQGADLRLRAGAKVPVSNLRNDRMTLLAPGPQPVVRAEKEYQANNRRAHGRANKARFRHLPLPKSG